MSSPIPPPADRKTFTPPIITALVALVVLAVITIVAVARSTGDSTTADAPGSTAPSSATNAAPSSRGMPSSDDSFTYLPPADFLADRDQDLYVVYLSNGAVVNSSDPDDWTTISVFTISANDESIEEYTAGSRESSLSAYEVVEVTTPLVAEIDGEETGGITIPPFGPRNKEYALDRIIAIRHGFAFEFTVSYPADTQEEARAAFIEFVNSVRWSY